MHTLMISLDAALAHESDSRRRHRAYAERAGRLTVITYTPPGAFPTTLNDEVLAVLPTRSRRKALFPLDALRLAHDTTPPVDLIVTQDPFATGFVGLRLRETLRVPLLVQNHSAYFAIPAWRNERPLRNRALLALGGFVVRRADFYRTVNLAERQAYIARGGDPLRAAALPLGTASSAFAQAMAPEAAAAKRAALGLAADERVILWVGYPVAFKRVPLLFEVFRHVLREAPARLVLVGDMARSPVDLAALACELGIREHVVLHGPVAHEDLPAYYALGDVYVHTSAYEGVPRVLFEASAAGLPLVAMRAIGVEEVIADGHNGYLVADGAVEAMAARILALLRDPERARAMGAAARQIALERYDAEGYPDRWVGLWRRAVDLGMRR